ncbi:hypothetical protein [Priestia megaterium]|nr:hypothetical protein [Priestia megaterium]
MIGGLILQKIYGEVTACHVTFLVKMGTGKKKHFKCFSITLTV